MMVLVYWLYIAATCYRQAESFHIHTTCAMAAGTNAAGNHQSADVAKICLGGEKSTAHSYHLSAGNNLSLTYAVRSIHREIKEDSKLQRMTREK